LERVLAGNNLAGLQPDIDLEDTVAKTEYERVVVVVASVVVPDHDEPSVIPEADSHQGVSIVVEENQIPVLITLIPKSVALPSI
jgi:hypothetical protein